MRPLPGIALAIVICVASSVGAQTPHSSQASSPQTARQALIEMFFGDAPDHLEKHFPSVTRRTLEKLKGANGQNPAGIFSALAMQAKAGKDKLETFDTGPTLLTVKEPAGASYDRVEVTVEGDEMVGDEDRIQLALHMISDGKEQPLLPLVLRFTFSMKMESEVWRLNEVSATARFPLADPVFLKAVEEEQLRQNEQTALWSVRAVVHAEKSYRAAKDGFACMLSGLGNAGKEGGATGRVYLYDSQLAGGKKNGYNFAISGCDPSHYRVTAEPEAADSGQRAFCSDESGAVRAASDGKATTCLASGEVVEDKISTTVMEENFASGTPVPAGRVRISQGVSAGLLISNAPPIYPPLARQSRIQGSVVVKAVISRTGDVESVELISGHPILAPAALDAVRQWKYRPYMLNGNAVEVETQVRVNFALPEH